MYLVMDLCRGGDLCSAILRQGSFTEKVAAVLARQMFAAVAYMSAAAGRDDFSKRATHCTSNCLRLNLGVVSSIFLSLHTLERQI